MTKPTFSIGYLRRELGISYDRMGEALGCTGNHMWKRGADGESLKDNEPEKLLKGLKDDYKLMSRHFKVTFAEVAKKKLVEQEKLLEE